VYEEEVSEAKQCYLPKIKHRPPDYFGPPNFLGWLRYCLG